MIKALAMVVSIAFIAVFGTAFLLPESVRVERGVDIARPVHTVFAVVDRAGALPSWVPAFSRDRSVEIQTRGPRSGPGGSIEWSGSERLAGKGFAEIVESEGPSRVQGKVLVEGQGRAEAEWRLLPTASGTRLTATVVVHPGAEQGFIGSVLSRWFGLVADSWLGGGLETLLDAVRRDVETLPAEDFGGMVVTVLDIEPNDAVISEVTDGDYATAFGRAAAFMAERGIERTDVPLLAYRSGQNGSMRVEAVIPAMRSGDESARGGPWGQTPSGHAVMASTSASGTETERVRARLVAWVRAHGFEPGDVAWERFVSDPGADDGGRRSTEVYVLFGPGS